MIQLITVLALFFISPFVKAEATGQTTGQATVTQDAGTFKVQLRDSSPSSFSIYLFDSDLKKAVTKRSKVIARWVDESGKTTRGPAISCLPVADEEKNHFDCQWNQKMLPDSRAKIQIKATRNKKTGAPVIFERI